MKAAFITGVTGQDGSYLSEFLLTKDYDVFGLARYCSEKKHERIDHLKTNPKFHLVEGDLTDTARINLIINSTVTPLTVKTLPDLLQKINQWNQIRKVYHYQNSVNAPSHMFIDLFGSIFHEDFERAIALKPEQTPEETASKNYLIGIAKQSKHSGPKPKEIHQLFDFLNTIDHRRKTHWPTVFPWLIDEFARHNLTL